MDKTIEIVVVAMVALLVAAILLFLVQDRATNFGNFLDSQESGAQCQLWKTQYENTACEGDRKKRVSEVFPEKDLSACGDWSDEVTCN